MAIKVTTQQKLARAMGDQAAAAELCNAIDVLAGLSSTEVEFINGVTPGTAAASKALVLSATSTLDSIGTVTAGTIATLGSTAATITKLTAGSGCSNAGTKATVSGGSANVASGNFSTVSGGALSTASGTYSVVSGGANNVASGSYSVAGGRYAVASDYHQEAYGAGRFAADGDAQRSTYTARALVDHDDADWHDLFTAGITGQMVLPTDTVWTFRILLVGTSVGCAKSFSFIIEGMIENDGDSTSIKASTVTTVYDTDDTDFDARVAADDTGTDALVIQVTDATSGGDVVRWVANIETVEVTFPAA